MRGKLAVLMVMLTVLFTLGTAPAGAISGGEVSSVVFACDHVTITYSEVLFDRDNTGVGAETYELEIVDGVGNQLFFHEDSRAIGATIVAASETFVFDIPPVANPIYVNLQSEPGNGFASQSIWALHGDCPDLPPSTVPPMVLNKGIPVGFVLANITCDTPVYNTAAGQPVGSAAITAGQTWYVNPTPVDGDDGQQWTEIYVSSNPNPFIPTNCVG